MINAEFKKRFLTNTDATGRYIVTSLVTGKVYYVESIDNTPHTQLWGDMNPSSRKLEGQYGKKYKGAVTEEESMITKESGFSKIHELKPGESPDSYIDRIDKEYQKQMKNKDKK